MKTIKNVLVVAFFMLGLTAFAQQNVGLSQNGPASYGREPIKGIVNRLNLSDDQQAKLKDIRKEYRQKDSVSFAEFRNQQEQKRIEELNAFKSILNKDQLNQLEKVQQNREYMAVFGGQNRPSEMGMRNHRHMYQNRPNWMNIHCPGNIGQNGPTRMGMQNLAQNGKKSMNDGRQDFARSGRNTQKDRAKSLTPEERAQKQTERLSKELNLTEKQITKIKEINQKYAEGSVMQSALKGKMTAKQNEIKSVLNKEQKEKYEALLENALNKVKKLDNEHDQQAQPIPMR